MAASSNDGAGPEGPARTAAEARAHGDRFYFTGRPCKRGHVAPRRASNNQCVLCAEFLYRERRAMSPEYFDWILRGAHERRADPAYRARETARRRERRADPAYRARETERRREHRADPAYRARENEKARERRRRARDADQ